MNKPIWLKEGRDDKQVEAVIQSSEQLKKEISLLGGKKEKPINKWRECVTKADSSEELKTV